MNSLGSSPGILAVERAVEEAILDEFRQIDRLGGVLAAVECRYQRSQIQSAAHRYEQQIYDGARPVIGLNRYNDENAPPDVKLVRTPAAKRKKQIDRLARFKVAPLPRRRAGARCPRKDSRLGRQRVCTVDRNGGTLLARADHRAIAGSGGAVSADGMIDGRLASLSCTPGRRLG